MPQNPCAACTRHHCCRDYIVIVTGSDVWRIARHFQIAPEQFLALCRSSVATFDCFRLGGPEQYRLALQKRGQEDAPLTERWCAFWVTLPGGTGRCAAYAARPRVCEAYPAFLDGGAVNFRADALCAAGSWDPSTADLPRWQRALASHAMEEGLYGAVVRAWNDAIAAGAPAAEVTPHMYYSHLIEIYGNIETILQELGPAELETFRARWVDWRSSGTHPLDPAFIAEPRWRGVLEALRLALPGSLQPVRT